jgi:quercetin dioxygenase-like cupin family protein
VKRIVIALSALLVAGAVGTIASASPPVGVTPTLLARGTYDSFKVRSSPHGPGDFKAEAKAPTDIVVRQHDYVPGSSTGWHTHPGPVFITVVEGEVTFYEYDDPTCTPTVVRAGEGYVDTGQGHIGRNETDQPARDVTVIIAPVDGAFRGELDAPGPHCDF